MNLAAGSDTLYRHTFDETGCDDATFGVNQSVAHVEEAVESLRVDVRPLPLQLALQGGGSHGAFTWGVLDALIEDGRVGFEAVTGASAGAMNAVVLVDGWLAGGPDGARAALETFWREASLDADLKPVQQSWIDGVFHFWKGTPS